MNLDVMIKILLMITTTFLSVTILVPFIKKVAIHVGALDIPNERKVHSKPMPRLGGLAMFLGFLLGYMIFGEPSSTMNSILIGSFIVVLTGTVDDIKPLKSSVKFAAQLVSAATIAIYGKLLIQNITVFGLYFDFGILSYPITIFFVLGCLNCINLIDGLDGLAAGISATITCPIRLPVVSLSRICGEEEILNNCSVLLSANSSTSLFLLICKNLFSCSCDHLC